MAFHIDFMSYNLLRVFVWSVAFPSFHLFVPLSDPLTQTRPAQRSVATLRGVAIARRGRRCYRLLFISRSVSSTISAIREHKLPFQLVFLAICAAK